MKKRIQVLVPVDFSLCSENALEFAIQFADKIKADIRVLHVPLFKSSVGESPASLPIVIRDNVKQSSEQMRLFVKKATDNVRTNIVESPSIKTSIELGKTELVIINEAVSKEIDYIIMGTQGEKSALDKYLGTMASTIVKNAPCSVMVIPENAQFKKKIELGYATDFSEVGPTEIWELVNLFKPFQLSIKCVHFNEKKADYAEKEKEIKSAFAAKIPEWKIEFHNLPVNNNVEFMNFFIENKQINMLVMYKPKRTFFESIFHKSYTQEMAKHVSIPLLVLKQ